MEVTEKEIRKEFQLERIIFFSDAVFAIAITLLIIDIRIPLQEDMTNKLLLQEIGEKVPELIGFFFSFLIVAGFWISHHSLFGYVQRFDQGLIWLNLFFLFFIILLPFSTSIFGVYGNSIVATSLYTLNVLLAGFMNLLCLLHIANRDKHLSKGLEAPEIRRAAYVRTIAIPGWIFICWLIGLITQPAIGDFFLFGLGFVIPVAMKLMKRKRVA